jgi:hypothetical protein
MPTGSNNFFSQLQRLPPDARSAVSACLGAMLTEINSGWTGAQASSGSGNGTVATKQTRAKRTTGTRGGTAQQHAEAGHLGGLAVAKKNRGGRPKKNQGLNQQAIS